MLASSAPSAGTIPRPSWTIRKRRKPPSAWRTVNSSPSRSTGQSSLHSAPGPIAQEISSLPLPSSSPAPDAPPHPARASHVSRLLTPRRLLLPFRPYFDPSPSFTPHRGQSFVHSSLPVRTTSPDLPHLSNQH